MPNQNCQTIGGALKYVNKVIVLQLRFLLSIHKERQADEWMHGMACPHDAQDNSPLAPTNVLVHNHSIRSYLSKRTQNRRQVRPI